MPTALLQIHTLHSQVTSLCPTPKQRKPQHTHPRWAGTGKVKPIWILLKQETVSGCGISCAICKSAHRSRQITTPEPHHSVFLQAGCPSCRPTNSVKALKTLTAIHNLSDIQRVYKTLRWLIKTVFTKIHEQITLSLFNYYFGLLRYLPQSSTHSTSITLSTTSYCLPQKMLLITVLPL